MKFYIFFTFLILFIFSTQSKNENSTILFNNKQNSKYAYASIFYEHSPSFFGLNIGLRVLIQSIKEYNTTADIVILVHPNTSQKYIDGFLKNGIILHRSEFPDPFDSEYESTYPQEFQRLVNRLLMWNLKEYERVIYIEPSTILVRNMDHLFECGLFCSVDTQPMMQANDIFVITPGNKETYHKIKSAIYGAVEMYKSYNNFGYIPELFDMIQAAPLFHENNSFDTMPLFQRLSTSYNLNHMFYYEKGNWDLYKCNFDGDGYPGYSLSYQYRVVPFSQPWLWFSYGYFFKLNHIWYKTRNSVMNDDNLSKIFWRVPIALILLFPVYCFRSLVKEKKNQKVKIFFEFIEWVGDNESLWLLLSIFICVVVYSIAFVLVPMLSSPLSGWIFFLTYGNVMLYMICSTLAEANSIIYHIKQNSHYKSLIYLSVFSFISILILYYSYIN